MGYCFAAAVTAEDALKAKAISWVMVGGLAGAIIGPQLVIFTRDAVAGTPYVGSFLSQALLPLIALPILLMLRTPSQTQAEAVADSGRTVLQLLAMPRYLLAVAAGVVSYGVMAFVMTAAPVAMVNHGHSVDNAALGIQWHLLAMFGPSFFTGRLMVRYGKERVTAVGMVLLAASGVVALGGLGLAGGQLDDLPGPGADPGAAAVAGRAKAGAASSGLIGAVQEALRAVGRLGRYSTCFHWRSLDSASS